MNMDPATLSIVAALSAVSLLAIFAAINLARNRNFTNDAPVYAASRWTGGNRVWPTQVAVFESRVVRHTPRLVGHFEETIPIAQVASVSIDAHLFFADVIIETTGGSKPIVCHGHWKKDADAIRAAIGGAQEPKR